MNIYSVAVQGAFELITEAYESLTGALSPLSCFICFPTPLTARRFLFSYCKAVCEVTESIHQGGLNLQQVQILKKHRASQFTTERVQVFATEGVQVCSIERDSASASVGY